MHMHTHTGLAPSMALTFYDHIRGRIFTGLLLAGDPIFSEPGLLVMLLAKKYHYTFQAM
jgi:hypothetical protein